ncbi:MAG: DUF4347 domain-containing protein, partial [Pseudomonadota bacterium]
MEISLKRIKKSDGKTTLVEMLEQRVMYSADLIGTADLSDELTNGEELPRDGALPAPAPQPAADMPQQGALLRDTEARDDTADQDTTNIAAKAAVAPALSAFGVDQGEDQQSVTAAQILTDTGEPDEVPTPVADEVPDDQSAPAPNDQPLHLVFVDHDIDNIDTLLADVQRTQPEDVEWIVVELATDTDGVAQITEALDGVSGVDGIHILANTENSALSLGTSDIN